MRVFWDHRCAEHPAPAGFPERPERIERILAHLLEQRGGSTQAGHEIVEASVTDERTLRQINELHDPALVDRFRRAVERGDGLLDSADNPIAAGSFRAAIGAAATTLGALEWILEAGGRRAFVATRPPGHHAERGRAMGFCFFNNVGLAAQAWAARNGGPVAIVDFDVHHGNGTQHLFEERADVFFVSLHQYPFYPGTGAAEERGRGAGEGATLNVPLPAGCDDARLRQAFDDIVLPALDRFSPRGILISAGFDAWRNDPLGGLRWTEAAFHHLGEGLAGVARRHSQGNALAVLEGGYDLAALGPLVECFLDGFGQGA